MKNGHSVNGKQQYICKNCGYTGVINPQPKTKHSKEDNDKILNAYFERPSIRGICRVFDVSRPTLALWLKKATNEHTIEDALLPAHSGDILELDEVWSFVKRRTNHVERWNNTLRQWVSRYTRKTLSF